MDGQNLQNTYPLLVSRMKENGYSEPYINLFRREIERLISDFKTNRRESYRDYYLSEAKKTKSASSLRVMRGIVGAIEQFDLYGAIPDRSHKTIILRDRGYDLLSEEFKGLIDVYRKRGKEKGKKEETVYKESHQATTFLLSLQDNNIASLNGITENAVLAAFLQEGKSRGYSYRNSVAAVFRTCITFFPDNRCERILSWLPALRVERKNIQYLSKEEVERISHVLENGCSCLSLRDRAIGLPALYTGLRGCDMVALKLDAIDWSKDLIGIRQQKTEVPLELPLMPVVGNLKRFLEEFHPGKPNGESYLFYSRNTGVNGKLSQRAVNKQLKKYAAAAHAECEEVPVNLHAHQIRHAKASHWLDDGMNIVQISFLLGHASIQTTMEYLDITLEQEYKALATIEDENMRNTPKKWKSNTNSLAAFCGISPKN